MKEFFLETGFGPDLHTCAWYPKDKPIGIVQIIHGIAEYAGRYDAFASFLADQGYLVVGEDHAGHGKTVGETGQYGYMDGGWSGTVKGIHALYQKIHEEYPNVPYFMLGHSMGSFLLRTYLFTYHTTLAGAIISGTGWQPAAILPAGRLLCKEEALRRGERLSSPLLQKLIFGSYNQAFAPARTPNDWLSRDEAVVDAYTEDPMCGFFPSIQLCGEMMGGIQMIQKKDNLQRMQKDLPILFISGEQDPVGAMGKGVQQTVAAFRDVGMQRVSCVLYPDMRHETLNEIGKEQVYHDILKWLTEHNDQNSCIM